VLIDIGFIGLRRYDSAKNGQGWGCKVLKPFSELSRGPGGPVPVLNWGLNAERLRGPDKFSEGLGIWSGNEPGMRRKWAADCG
jgi:hypothetical protein